jgi:hypothetical protein
LSVNFVVACNRHPLTKKGITSQHYGFGTLSIDALASDNIRNKTTGLEASGKFQEKLMLK